MSGTGPTMAATLPAPPERVWPWLVQMGFGRAGWYSWDRIDNGGRPSATAIRPELQRLEEGERVPAGRRTWFTVERLDPPRVLVLRYRGTAWGRMLGPDDPLPWGGIDAVWGLRLADPGDGTTRLVVRTAGVGRPRAAHRAADLLAQPGHVVMQRRQMAGLRRRVMGDPG